MSRICTPVGSELEKELRLAMIQHTQPQGLPRPELLQAVQTTMPRTTWLHELPELLQSRLSQLVVSIPPELRMQLNLATAGGKR